MRYKKNNIYFSIHYYQERRVHDTKKDVCTIPRRDPALVRKSLQKCNVVWNVKTYVCAY